MGLHRAVRIPVLLQRRARTVDRWRLSAAGGLIEAPMEVCSLSRVRCSVISLSDQPLSRYTDPGTSVGQTNILMRDQRQRLLNASVALPLMTVASFYALIGCLRLAQGHWPSLNNPDPGMLASLPLLLLSTSILPLLALTFVSPSLVVALAIHHRCGVAQLRPVAAFAASWGAWALLAWFDPGHFWFWYFD